MNKLILTFLFTLTFPFMLTALITPAYGQDAFSSRVLVHAEWQAGQSFQVCSKGRPVAQTEAHQSLEWIQLNNNRWQAQGITAGRAAFLLPWPQPSGCLWRKADNGLTYPPLVFSGEQLVSLSELPDQAFSLPLMAVYKNGKEQEQEQDKRQQSAKKNNVLDWNVLDWFFIPTGTTESPDSLFEISGGSMSGDFPFDEPRKPGFPQMGKNDFFIDITPIVLAGSVFGINVTINGLSTYLSEKDLAWLQEHLWSDDFEQQLADHVTPDVWQWSWLSDQRVRLTAMKAVGQELKRANLLEAYFALRDNLSDFYQYPLSPSPTSSSSPSKTSSESDTSSSDTSSSATSDLLFYLFPLTAGAKKKSDEPDNPSLLHDHSRCCPHPDCSHGKCKCLGCIINALGGEYDAVTLLESFHEELMSLIKNDDLEGLRKYEEVYGAQALGRVRLAVQVDVDVYYISASLLYLGIRQRAKKIVSYLVEQGHSNINEQAQAAPDMTNNRTPLMMAVTSGQTELISLLLEHGADINMVDELGFNAETIALNFILTERHEDSSVLETLTQHRKDKNIRGQLPSFIDGPGGYKKIAMSQDLHDPDEIEAKYRYLAEPLTFGFTLPTTEYDTPGDSEASETSEISDDSETSEEPMQ